MNPVITFTLLTLNIWGLPDLGFKVLAPLREERVQAICSFLEKSQYETVLIQEAWLLEDREKLKNCGFPFSVDLNDSKKPLDSGLMILSKAELKEVQKLTFPALPSKFQDYGDGEYFARKGAILAKVVPKNHPPYWIGNTHLVSQYQMEEKDDYRNIRKYQIELLFSWIKQQTSGPVILGGDFNTDPKSSLWQEIVPLLDPFRASQKLNSLCTLCPPNTMHETNEGIVDYFLWSQDFVEINTAVTATQPLTLEGVSMSLSDHFGVETTFSSRYPLTFGSP